VLMLEEINLNTYCGHKRLSCDGFLFSVVKCIGCVRGQDSSVSIVTCYRLDGAGIESWWGQDFPHPSRLALGTNQPPIRWVPGLSWGKAVRCGVDYPLLSSAKVKEGVGLYV
jgi:hypothetical protein